MDRAGALSGTAVFLDRDGTIIVDRHYPNDPEQVLLVDGVIGALRGFRTRGHRLIVVSNQSGVARGLISPEELNAVHQRMVQLLAQHEIQLDGAYYCQHGPDAACDCRKPAPGMLLAAARDLNVRLDGSLMIGDKVTDVQAGRAAGCTTALLGDASLGSESRADFHGPDWATLLLSIPAAFA